MSSHFVFVLLDEETWMQIGLGNIKDFTGRTRILGQNVYPKTTKNHTSGVSALTCESLPGPLLPQQTHWQELSLTVLYLLCATKRALSKCILRKLRFAFWPGRSILCQREPADGSPCGCYCIEKSHIKYLLKHTSELHAEISKEAVIDEPAETCTHRGAPPLPVGLTVPVETGWRTAVWAVILARGSRIFGSYHGACSLVAGFEARTCHLPALRHWANYIQPLLDFVIF